MGSSPCPRCGGLAPVGATFCPFCGASLRPPLAAAATPAGAPSAPGIYSIPSGSVPPPPGPPPGYYPPYGMPGPVMPLPGPTPATRAVDLQAVTYLLWASVSVLAGGLIAAAALFVPGILGIATTTGANPAITIRWEFYLLLAIDGAVGVTTTLLLRFAFRTLTPVDVRFSTPSTLSILLIVGLVLVLAGVYPLFVGYQSFFDCTSTSTNQTTLANCPGLTAAVLGLLALLAGSVIGLVGYIGCLIGVWRFGSRYGSDAYRIGAILLLFPLLNVVGAILILIAAHSTREELHRTMGGPVRSF